MQDIAQGHTVESYNEDLVKLRGLVLEMGDLVIEQVGLAVQCLFEGDADLARKVAARDSEVDQLDMQANEDILRILVVRQPKASDMRLVLGLMRAVDALAKVGNKAKKIAGFAIGLHTDQHRIPRKRLLRDVHLMSERACDMLQRSLDALIKIDAEAAVAIGKEDDALDDEFDAGMRHLVTFMLEDSSSIARVLDMVFALKALERVGDHASHIAEQVIFIAKGRDVRYANAEFIAD